jgi:hypothetical protein
MFDYQQMQLRCRIQWISPRKWFPAYDPIARSVARLCVLHEDLYLEWLALAAQEITITLHERPEEDGPNPGLDDNGGEYRRMYFLRASIHTLAEVYSAVSSLRNNQDFRRMYKKFNPAEFAKFVDYIRDLDKNLKEVKRIRNALGGHVSREGIESALKTMDFHKTGKFEVGKKVKDTHFGFATTICNEIFLPEDRDRTKPPPYVKITELNLKTMDIISNVLLLYLDHHKLI